MDKGFRSSTGKGSVASREGQSRPHDAVHLNSSIQDYQRADAIKRANPASWKQVNLYGAYTFLDIGDGVDLQELVILLEAARDGCAAAPD